jgi:hypothetical protein
MRRTRGDIGLCLLFADAECFAAVVFFLAGAVLLEVLPGLAVFDAVADCLSEDLEPAGGEACWGKATKLAPLRSPHIASIHHRLRPNRTTLIFSPRGAEIRT